MPSYFVNNGIKQEMSNEKFDMIWNSIINSSSSECSFSSDETEEVEKTTKTSWRRQPNGYYNSKPIDENYFKKYYQDKTKQNCICEICGTQLSCKSNLAKHRKTKKCRSFLN